MKKNNSHGISRMDTPDSREEFEHNTNLILEESNNMEDAAESAIGSFMTFTYPELAKLRKLPNGRLNLLTVTEQLRLNANTRNMMSKLDPLEIDEELE